MVTGVRTSGLPAGVGLPQKEADSPQAPARRYSAPELGNARQPLAERAATFPVTGGSPLHQRGNFLRRFLPQQKEPMPDEHVQELRALRGQRVAAVDMLLKTQPGLFLDTVHDAFAAKKREFEAQPPRAKEFKKFEKQLIELLVQHLPPQGRSQKQLASIAKAHYKAAVTESLNHQDWKQIRSTFYHQDQFYTSRLTPAGQLKLGDKSIFKVDYEGKGVSSGSTKCTDHATNLWMSEFSAAEVSHALSEDREKMLYRGIRHGILSPYGLKNRGRQKTMREEGALNRAREVASAALFMRLSPEKLQAAIATGETVKLKLTSTSLVTAFNIGKQTEGKQLADQLNAWKKLGAEKPCVLDIRGKDGQVRQINVELDVAAFNFGVNEAAFGIAGVGWAASDAQNAEGLKQLLGEDLKPGGAMGGWVADYLRQDPPPKNAKLVGELSNQIREIWDKKLHHEDGGEPYKLAMRIALLSHEIGDMGVVPCYNCKSGKDRTGWLDSEIKRMALHLHNGGDLPPVGAKLASDQKTVFRKLLEKSGNLEIQKQNTGAPGNKVLKKLSNWGRNLSLRDRIGDEKVFNKLQNLSPVVSS